MPRRKRNPGVTSQVEAIGRRFREDVQKTVDESGGRISSIKMGIGEGDMVEIASANTPDDPEAEAPYVPRVRAPEGHALALPQSVDEDGAIVQEHLPDDQFPVPEDKRFAFTAWLEAPELAEVADALIAEHDAFAHIDGVSFNILWRHEGGETNGRATLGRWLCLRCFEDALAGVRRQLERARGVAS